MLNENKNRQKEKKLAKIISKIKIKKISSSNATSCL
jgi:hypothetical protein